MHILIARNSSNQEAVDASLLLTAYLMSQDIPCTMLDAYDLNTVKPQDFDLAVALGGDGTMLRVAHFAADSGLPILGLNFGHLGFLVNEAEDGVVAALASALSGEVARDERTNMRVEILCEGDDEELFDSSMACPECLPDNRHFCGLNEAALTHGASGKIVDFDLSISGEHIANMRGDGLVVATATGSTAYALSAGGPLVAPGFAGLLAVPIAPHTLVARAIVTDPHDVVEVEMTPSRANDDAELFIDGDLCQVERPLRRIRVSRGATPTVTLRCQARGFYRHASEVFFK